MRLQYLIAATAFIAMSPLFGGTVVLFNELNAPISANDFVLEDGPLYASFSTGSTPVMLSDVMAKLTVKHDEGFAVLKHGHASIPGQNFVGLPRLSQLGTTVGLYADKNRYPGALISTIGFLADSALHDISPTSRYV